MIGYRRVRGKWTTQSNCHSCMAILGANPTRKTGPNRKRISGMGDVVFGRQKDTGPDEPVASPDEPGSDLDLQF